MNGKYHEINDDVKITCPVPEILMHLMEDAEAADIRNDGSYDNLADTIDVYAKNFYADGKLTRGQWDIIVMRYPQLVIKNASNTQTAYGIKGHSLSSAHFPDLCETQHGLREAIEKVVPETGSHIQEIHEFISQIPEEYCGADNRVHTIYSANRKKLFFMQLHARYENLLLPYYKKMKNTPFRM